MDDYDIEEDIECTTMDTNVNAIKTHLPANMTKLSEKALHYQLGHVGSATFGNGEICTVCAAVRGSRKRRYKKKDAFVPTQPS